MDPELKTLIQKLRDETSNAVDSDRLREISERTGKGIGDLIIMIEEATGLQHFRVGSSTAFDACPPKDPR